MLKKVYTLIQAPVWVLVLICAAMQAQAQINFKNPSFEDTPGAWFKTPHDWQVLYYVVSTCPVKGQQQLFTDFLDAYDSLTYIAILCPAYVVPGDDTTCEGFYQKLPCPLLPNIHYSVSFFAYNFREYVASYEHGGRGGFKVWLSNTPSLLKQLIYARHRIDTFWSKYSIEFTPDSFYNYFIVQGEELAADWPIGQTYLMFDKMSPITFNHQDYIRITASDTLVHSIKNITLRSRHVKDSGLSYTWQSIPPGISSTDSMIEVKPLQTARYILTGHFSCGMDVSDTLKVHVAINGGGGGAPPPFIQTFIAKNNNWIIESANTPIAVKVYDAIGQLLYTDDNYQNTLNPALLNWATGVYLYSITYGSGDEERGKLLVINK